MHAPVMVWGVIMITHAMQSATMGHIQENRVGAMQDGMGNVATTVRTFIELLFKDSFILSLFMRY